MTATQKIKATILLKAMGAGDFQGPPNPLTVDTVDALYETFDEDYRQQYEEEFRYGEVRTGLECDWSRHYESEAVASKIFDGSWVGWVYWFGGGKHGQPESVDWMTDAYDLDCKEEEKVVVVKTFTRKES